MKKYIPYEKLSKKKQRELDRKQRLTWGSLSPVTRNTANPKAYNRQKARKWDRDDYPPVPFSLHTESRLYVYRCIRKADDTFFVA